jgi:hypothetical protein
MLTETEPYITICPGCGEECIHGCLESWCWKCSTLLKGEGDGNRG